MKKIILLVCLSALPVFSGSYFNVNPPILAQDDVSMDLNSDFHTDIRFAYKFKVPKDWIGTPPPENIKVKSFAVDESVNEFIITSEYNHPRSAETLFIRSSFIPAVESFEAAELYMKDILLGQAKKFKIISSSKPKNIDTVQKKDYLIEADFENVTGIVSVGILLNKRSACAISCFRTAKESEKYDELFNKVIDSFKPLAVQEKGSLSEKYGRKAVLVSGWNIKKSKYYTVHYRLDKEFADNLTDRLESAMDKYMSIFKYPKSPRDFPVMTVKILENYKEFIRYGGTAGAAAYYSPLTQELVCYQSDETVLMSPETGEIALVADEPGEITFHIIYHEGFHEYLFCYINDETIFTEIPIWLNEGMAEYFFAGNFEKRKLNIGMNTLRLISIKEAVKRNDYVPFQKFFQMSQKEYYDNASVCYAQGWAVCYFLLTSPNKNYNKIPKELMDSLKDTKSYQKAFLKAFDKIDIYSLENEWKSFVSSLEVPDLTPKTERNTELAMNIGVIPDAPEEYLKKLSGQAENAAYLVWFLTQGRIKVNKITITDKTDAGNVEIQRIDNEILVTSYSGNKIKGYAVVPGEKVLTCGALSNAPNLAKGFMVAFLYINSNENDCPCFVEDPKYEALCNVSTHKGQGGSCMEKIQKIYPKIILPNPEFQGKAIDDQSLVKKFPRPEIKISDN